MLLFAIGQSQQIMTPLESFLALHFGLLLAFSAVGLVVNVTSFHFPRNILSQPLPHTKMKLSADSFPFPSGCPASARQEGTANSPTYRAHSIFLTSERLPLI